jgi:hypothetical protein
MYRLGNQECYFPKHFYISIYFGVNTKILGGVAVGRMGSWSKGTSSLCQMVDYIIECRITLCIFDHLPQGSFVDCVQFVDCI